MNKRRRRGTLGKILVACVAPVVMLALGLGVAPNVAWADAAQDAGITVNLHDYNDRTINNGHSLKFNTGNGSEDYNKWTGGYPGFGLPGNDGAYQGIVSRNLVGDNPQEGYPQLAVGKKESLEYLFGNNGIATNRLNVSGLFGRKSSDGYWTYDSDATSATYQQRSNSIYRGMDNGGFWPFGVNSYHFGMDVSADFLMPKDGKVNGQDMVFEFSGDDDVWVYIDGMLVLDIGGIHGAVGGSINFATGDVTVERVYDGPYNDSTNNAQNTNLLTMMRAALEEKYGKGDPKVETELREKFKSDENGNLTSVLKDYGTHSLKFFYLERGSGQSNCKIRFNLQTIPDGQIDVGKQVDYASYCNVSDIDFQFKAFINTEGTDNADDYQLYEGPYSVYRLKDDSPVEDKQNLTATDGVITLKDGEYARLNTEGLDESAGIPLIKQNSTYYLEEIGVTSDKYDVTLEGTSVQVDDTYSDGVRTGCIEADESQRVVFHNSVSAENSFNLQVEKRGEVDADATFYVKVMIGSQAYVGDYIVYGTDGNQSQSRTDEKGIIPIKTGQHIEIRGIVGGNTVTVCEVTADGQPFVNQSDYQNPAYRISGSNDGTLESYKYVTDDQGNKTGVTGTAAEGTALGNNPVVAVTITNTPTVKPVLVSDFLTVNKIVRGHALGEHQFDFTVTPVNGTDTTAEQAATLASISVDGLTFDNGQGANAGVNALVRTGNELTFTPDMIGRTYAFEYREVQNSFDSAYVTTGDAPVDYDFDDTVYRVELTPEMKDGSNSEMHVKMEIFKDDGEEPIVTVYNDGTDVKTGSITFENTYHPLGLQVTKTDTDGAALSGAKFVLYADTNGNGHFDDGESGDQPAEGITGGPEMASDGSVTTDANGQATFSGLQHGATYFLVEEAVPSGYNYVLRGAYKIVVDADGNIATMTKPGEASGEEMSFDNSSRRFTTTIQNRAIEVLPQSGSSGTVAMGAIGVATVALAGAYFFQKRMGLQH